MGPYMRKIIRIIKPPNTAHYWLLINRSLPLAIFIWLDALKKSSKNLILLHKIDFGSLKPRKPSFGNHKNSK